MKFNRIDRTKVKQRLWQQQENKRIQSNHQIDFYSELTTGPSGQFQHREKQCFFSRRIIQIYCRERREKIFLFSMTNRDEELELFFRRKYSPPPSVLLSTVTRRPDEQDEHRQSPRRTVDHRSISQKQQNQLERSSNSLLSRSTFSYSTWQRQSDRSTRNSDATDIAYRNTYLETKDDTRSRSTSPRTVHSFQSRTNVHRSPSNHPPTYFQIRESIKEMEQHRRRKQENLSVRITRPQNDDPTFRRIVKVKRENNKALRSITTFSVNSSSNKHKSSVDRTTNEPERVSIALINQHLKSPKSFVNYMNYSRSTINHRTESSQIVGKQNVSISADR